MELTNNLKKRLCKDFKLPINVFEEPYFSYFVDLYEPVYQVKEKITWLEQAIERAGGVEEFFSLGSSIAQSIKQTISNTQAYKTLNEIDLNKDFPLVLPVKQQNIYIVPNIGQTLISIDLEKANFNCLNLFGIKKELGIDSYQELMLKNTDLSYYLNSKMIRQVIFGDLNPSRQQRIQKYIINQMCIKLQEIGCELSSASSDEIIIKNDISISKIKEALEQLPKEFQFYRVEPFIFERIAEEQDFFIKTTQTKQGDKIEFKNTPGHLFAQIYKKHFNLPIQEQDMLFYHEGFLAQFKEPLFKQELTVTTKPRIK